MKYTPKHLARLAAQLEAVGERVRAQDANYLAIIPMDRKLMDAATFLRGLAVHRNRELEKAHQRGDNDGSEIITVNDIYTAKP